jgi:DNA-directed RNA polymerase sigma subunit (sigma70/sigma32)
MSSADYEESDLDMQIRPTGSESIFDEPDPNRFVGNGRASDIGPGRGYGRVKKTPPIELKDFYDDSVVKFEKMQRQNIAPSVNMDEDTDNTSQQKRRKQKRQQPINRGTPRDFVEMMLTGKEAKQRMIQCNMRLVVSIARKYYNVGVNVQDLVQEGSIGLARAAEKFEPSRGFKFSTYASW